MRIINQKITIITYRKPHEQTINEELQWFAKSLGMFGERDIEGSCFRLFIELLKIAKEEKTISSDELGMRLELSRGTIVHHLNRLMQAGIVMTDGRRYLLRDNNLQSLVESLKQDTITAYDRLKEAAKD